MPVEHTPPKPHPVPISSSEPRAFSALQCEPDPPCLYPFETRLQLWGGAAQGSTLRGAPGHEEQRRGALGLVWLGWQGCWGAQGWP